MKKMKVKEYKEAIDELGKELSAPHYNWLIALLQQKIDGNLTEEQYQDKRQQILTKIREIRRIVYDAKTTQCTGANREVPGRKA
jgi:uncharacterized protein (DUF169 family)